MISKFKQIEELFHEIDENLKDTVKVYIIGGAALLFEGLKPATKDIDLILKDKDEFNFFNKSLVTINFKEENPSGLYKKMELNKIMVREDYRIDAFLKKVCKKFALSNDMIKRSNEIISLKNISVNKCSNEDIFLFKSMTERPGDLEDCIELIKKGLNWNEIKEEMINQIKTNGEDVWITWIGERLDELNLYAPSCRYLLELATFINISGKERMNTDTWQNICPVVMRMLTIATISDYIFHLSDFFDVKVEIDFEKGHIFNIIIDENPIEKYKEDYIEGLKDLDLSKYLLKDDKREALIEDGIQYSPTDDIIKKTIEKSRQLICEENNLNEISKNLKKKLGFDLIELRIVPEIFAYKEPNMFGIIEIKKEELINFVNQLTSIEKKTIEKIIDFYTLNIDIKESKIIRPWEKEARKNKLTVKPLINIDNTIYFGSETLIFTIDKIFKLILEGRSPIPEDFLPKDVTKALNKRKTQLSKDFEKEVFSIIKENSDFSERNIESENGKNTKCLKDIEEVCPGEIDAISIHKDKKTMVLWEAKDIEEKYNTREICYNLTEFIEKEKGYIPILKRKEDFIRKHSGQIKKYYNIKNEKTWKIKSCIVLSSHHIEKYILRNRINIINFTEIPDFINNM